MMTYIYAGVGILILILAAALKIEVSRYDALQKEYIEFKAAAAALGKAAQKAADERYLRDVKAKEIANEESKRAIAELSSIVTKLRAQRSSRNFVPSPTGAAAGSNTVTFNRAELERAIRSLDSGVQILVDEGSKATVDLNVAKLWAADTSRSELQYLNLDARICKPAEEDHLVSWQQTRETPQRELDR